LPQHSFHCIQMLEDSIFNCIYLNQHNFLYRVIIHYILINTCFGPLVIINIGSVTSQHKRPHIHKISNVNIGKSKLVAVKFTVHVYYLMMAKRLKYAVVNIHIQKVLLMKINTIENTTQQRYITIVRRQYI
jgi:hypothetical protein